MSDYFLIYNSVGDTFVRKVKPSELVSYLNNGVYDHKNFASDVPDVLDTNYWGDRILLIKGEIIVPKAKKKVVEYEI